MAHHEFTPKVYYSAIGSHDPVLQIDDGDSVSTTTVDARGHDSTGDSVTPGGNPQTGPFYINSAEPGDTICVTLDKLLPNRKVGWTSSQIAANVLDFGYIPKFDAEKGLTEWEVDVDSWTASPLGFDSGPLSTLKLPICPMVGCFGVAPARGQAISTSTSDRHGGNMDYRGYVEGVKCYFPVFVEGALFHIGDGHAVQGDGEIVGTGIEISFDVTFTVHLLKGKESHWPRAENDTHLMALGNARPLDLGVQFATTELVEWLHTDYGLDYRTIHVLLGQVIEYDLGNVYDPAYTMVSKIRKEDLARVGVKA